MVFLGHLDQFWTTLGFEAFWPIMGLCGLFRAFLATLGPLDNLTIVFFNLFEPFQAIVDCLGPFVPLWDGSFWTIFDHCGRFLAI